MASMMTTSSVNAFLASATDMALAQFIRVYADVLVSRGVKGPSPDDLMRWMREEFEGGVVPGKAAADEVVVKTEAESDEVEVVGVKPVAASSSAKVPAKLLKKLVVKTGVVKQRKVKQKDDTVKVVDYEETNLVDLPYLPHCVDYSECCQGIVANGNLFTPCLTRPSKGSEYCKLCAKNNFKYGTLQDREKCEVGKYQVQMDTTVQVKDKETNEVSTVEKTITKKEISYGTWLQKRKMDRAFVEALIAEHGLDITIPESYFEVNKTKAKRGVKKAPSTSSDDETSSVESAAEEAAEDKPIKRERPTKVEEPKPVAESESDSVAEEPAKEEPKPKPQLKKRGRPAKEAPKQVEEQVLADAEDEDDEPTPAAEEPAKEEPKSKTNEIEIDEVDDEGISYFTYQGKRYGFDDENTLFSIGEEDDDAEIVGAWDPEEKRPVFMDEEE